MGLLSEAELAVVQESVGPRCVLRSPTVAQLYLADENPNSWRYTGFAGAVAVVKDAYRKDYFIRVLSLDAPSKVLWEQAIYKELEYGTDRSYFHTFETDSCTAGLNFASEPDAQEFCNAVKEEISKKNRAKKKPPAAPTVTAPPQQKTAPAAQSVTNNVPVRGAKMSTSPKSGRPTSPKPEGGRLSSFFGSKKKKGGAKKLTAADISGPAKFEHVSHIGWDAEKGFDVDNIPENWQTVFDKVGITNAQLKADPELGKFVMNEMSSMAEKGVPPPAAHAPPPPKQVTPPPSVVQPPAPVAAPVTPVIAPVSKPPPSSGRPTSPLSRPPSGRAPAPPASRTSTGRSAPPAMPPARSPSTKKKPGPPPAAYGSAASLDKRDSTPPPPPPAADSRPTSIVEPPPPAPAATAAAPPPPPPAAGAPPPPPPPPASGGPPPPPPPPAADGASSRPTSAGQPADLLAAIRGGATLKKHTDEPSSRPTSSGGGQDDLLAAIRGGATLKKVNVEERPVTPQTSALDGMAGALARALEARNQAMAGNDSDDDDDDSDWDD